MNLHYTLYIQIFGFWNKDIFNFDIHIPCFILSFLMNVLLFFDFIFRGKNVYGQINRAVEMFAVKMLGAKILEAKLSRTTWYTVKMAFQMMSPPPTSLCVLITERWFGIRAESRGSHSGLHSLMSIVLL